MVADTGESQKGKNAGKSISSKTRKRQSLHNKDSPDFKFRKLNQKLSKHTENENIDSEAFDENCSDISNGLLRGKGFENSIKKARVSSRDCKETALVRMKFADSCEQLEIDVQSNGLPYVQTDTDSCSEDSAKDDKSISNTRVTASSENSAKVSPSSKMLEEFNSK